MSRAGTIFIPHYGDHQRLSFQLNLFQKYIDTSGLSIVIYDSSKSTADKEIDFSIYQDLSIRYRICCQDIEGNTYSNVFKEFCKSNDSENGAFILPIDEFIYLNIDEFESRPDKMPYSCANQISLDPTSFKIAEYERCIKPGIANASKLEQYTYFPQIHATYFPPNYLKSFGNFLETFLNRFGNANSLFFDLLILEILHNTDVYYSKKSYYIQEKLPKRKTAGVFNHPALFISRINDEEKRVLFKMINEEICEPLNLTYEQRKLLTTKIFSQGYLKRGLYMPNINTNARLFKLNLRSEETIKVEKIDTFVAYHHITMKTQSKFLRYLFNNMCFLGDDTVLELCKSILKSY